MQIDPRFSLAFAKKKKEFAVPAPLAPIADTHAHLMSFWGKDPAEVIARAAFAGVRQMTTIWDPLADHRDAATYHEQLVGWIVQAEELIDQALAAGVALAQPAGAQTAPVAAAWDPNPKALLSQITFLAGVHPYGAPEYTDQVHAQVLAALDDPLCSGVGEIGLDYHFDAEDSVAAAPHQMQMDVMARQLKVAVERNLPVELHLRHEADDVECSSHVDACNVLKQVGVPAAGCVLHCFGEDRATMERFCELGCHIAFGGAATFKRNDEVREAFAACPLDLLLFETDCPYMAPEPIRGLECEPAMIPWTVEALTGYRSSVTGEDPAQIAYAVWRNSLKLFGRQN